jgi:hypothetical protein
MANTMVSTDKIEMKSFDIFVNADTTRNSEFPFDSAARWAITIWNCLIGNSPLNTTAPSFPHQIQSSEF